ncbi:unnamed protein product [Taenia asiatica]|uniref:Hemocyanin_N domain-containing protein n=1 Tax=Taenia asiatica TaxID=60517 RepID=A0A158R757_TAEAS|nr:unnamed protein product [Taenia asiatica]
MFKALTLLLLIPVCQVPSSRAEFFGYYLDYFNLRDKYIPFLNDDVESINRHKGMHLLSQAWYKGLLRLATAYY